MPAATRAMNAGVMAELFGGMLTHCAWGPGVRRRVWRYRRPGAGPYMKSAQHAELPCCVWTYSQQQDVLCKCKNSWHRW